MDQDDTMTQLTDPRRDAVLSVHLSAKTDSSATPAHRLLAGYAARLESAGFGQTGDKDEQIVLAWVRRSARLSCATTTTFAQFADAWFRILDRYEIIPRVTAS